MNIDIRAISHLELASLIMHCSAELLRRHAAVNLEQVAQAVSSIKPTPPDVGEADLVATIISEQLGVPLDMVAPNARLVEDLGADSLDLVELTMALEDTLAVELNDTQEKFIAQHVRTVDDVRKFVKGL